MPKQPSTLDLFCGAGGLALGFQNAGYSIVGGIDNVAVSIDTFNANVADDLGMVRDLRKGDFGDIDKFLNGKRIDVIIGGPACQGFSTSGGLSRATGRNQADPRNRLFTNYIDLVEHLSPKWIVFENVPGLLLYNQGAVALEIIRSFREIGFVLVPMILLAADFGVPQLRRRLFFIGTSTGDQIPFPSPTHGDSGLWKGYSLPFAHLSRIGHGDSRESLPHLTFSDACSDLPPVAEASSIDGIPYCREASTNYQATMRLASDGIRQHTAAKLGDLDRLAARRLRPGENWRSIPLDLLPPRFAKIRRYDATTILKRLRADRPAYTITTKFNEGTTGAFIHPDQPRTLTLREAARIQGFPDRFVFSGTAPQIRRQIGNAVPVQLAQAIAEAMLPAVVSSTQRVTMPQSRDAVLFDHDVQASDILRLRSPRRRAQKLVAQG